MKIESLAENRLRLSQSNTYWRLVLLSLAVGVIAAAKFGIYPDAGADAICCIWLSAGACGLLALWLPDCSWTFDDRMRSADWQRSWLLWRQSGVVSFDRLRRVVQAVCEGAEKGGDPDAYLVALGLLGEAIPVTSSTAERVEGLRRDLCSGL